MPADTTRLVEGVRAGERRALARLITRIENQAPGARDALAALYPHTGHAAIVGITGAPGTGKSSVVNALARVLRMRGQTVGIIAVDPTSPFSGGAVLGDRVRMTDLAGDRGVFIRSMASRGSLGGLAAATHDVTHVLDAAGFDVVLIETVGAGQSEVDIAHTAHTTIVVDAPGLGDEVQAIKAGILEIADILVVNKADRPGVENTVRALRAMVELGHRQRAVPHHGHRLIQDDGGAPPEPDTWPVPILKTVAIENRGLDALADAIERHRAHLTATGQMHERERHRVETALVARLRDVLLERLVAGLPPGAVQDAIERVTARELDPGHAVEDLLDRAGNP